MKGVAITILMVASASALLEKADKERAFRKTHSEIALELNSFIQGFVSILFAGVQLGSALQGLNFDASSFSKRMSYLVSRNKLEKDIVSDMLEAMMYSDPGNCFHRWICDVATHEEKFWDMHPFLEFASNDWDLFVPHRPRVMEYSKQLKSARRVGENAASRQVCEDTFQCPFTGEQMTQMVENGG